MDNAQKAIMIGVGLFITIIIISAVLLIVNLGTGLVDDATANLSSISSTLQSQILQNYDAKLLSGTQVRTAINQYMTSSELSLVLVEKEGESDPMATSWAGAECLLGADIDIEKGRVVLDTNAVIDSSDSNYSATKISSLSELSDPEDSSYVNTSSRYYSYIIYNSKEAMVGIIFVPQKAQDSVGGTLTVDKYTKSSGV